MYSNSKGTQTQNVKEKQSFYCRSPKLSTWHTSASVIQLIKKHYCPFCTFKLVQIDDCNVCTVKTLLDELRIDCETEAKANKHLKIALHVLSHCLDDCYFCIMSWDSRCQAVLHITECLSMKGSNDQTRFCFRHTNKCGQLFSKVLLDTVTDTVYYVTLHFPSLPYFSLAWIFIYIHWLVLRSA